MTNRFLYSRWKAASRTTMAAVLALGVAGGSAVLPQTAVAQEEPAMSRDFQNEIVKVQEAFQAAQAMPGFAEADAAARGQMLSGAIQALAVAETKIETAKDRQVYGQFSYNIGNQSGDEAMQSAGLMGMLDSGLTEPGLAVQIAGEIGQKFYNAQDYAQARTYFEQAITLGSTEPEVKSLVAESYFAEGNYPGGYAVLDEAIAASKAAGELPPPLFYRRGLTIAFENENGAEAIKYSRGLMQDYPQTDSYADAINTIRSFGQLDNDAMLDLLRLMNRTNSYKQSFDYAEHVEAADPRRLPGEVIAVIDNGYTSGVLERSNSSFSQLRAEANNLVSEDRGSLSGLASEARSGGSAQLASGTGDAFLGYGMAAEAEEMYRVALERPGVDAEKVMTRLGIALFDQGKFGEAQQMFEQVDGARKAVADLWGDYAAQSAQ